MKKYLALLVILAISITTFQSCDDIDDSKKLPIQDFIWKGLNLYYYWQKDVPNLADNKFYNQASLNTFLSTYDDPTLLFNDLLFEKGTTDRFSVIFSDYGALEQILTGTQGTNGVDYELRYKQGSTTDIFGWVRYIMPNSDASNKPIQRGMIFYGVNGTPLTASNYRDLLGASTYTLNFADYDNGAITPNGISLNLTKTAYSENPVYITKTIIQGDKKIGYLMYNGFYSSYEPQLNAAFAQLTSEGITHLIIDLRYNSGGSVATCTRLASMITGQFTSQLFAKQEWNQKVENYYNQNNPENLINRFTSTIGNGSAINSLNLNKLYVITTKRTASASELLINGLKPYITIVQLGDVTIGKNVGSVTLYDSPTFSKQNVNSNHRYAMQPIVLKTINKNGFGDYQNGISPNTTLLENYGNLGELGEMSDPLLSSMIGFITNNGRMMAPKPDKEFVPFQDSKSMRAFGDEMYLDEIPEGLKNILVE